MEIKFDVYFKKNLGTLFKNNEVDLNGLPARTNLQLVLVDRLEINYKVGSNKYTDIVTITDSTENLIQIPFKSDVMKVGLNEFEIVAYMKNGDVKTSQTYTYNIDEAIGEGKQTGSGGSSDGHTHNNLNVLNSITQSKVSEWDNKADRNHTHSNYASATHSHIEYASKSHTHNASEIEGLENVNIDLSDYYTKSETYNKTEIDSKIANMGAGGSVDLSNYYTKSETDEAMNNKADKVHTHSEYLTELPTHTHSEYLTEHQDISHKADKEDTYTKNQTDSKISEEIAKAQLGGGSEVDLSAYATKKYVDDETTILDSKIEKIKTFEQYNSFYNSMIKGTANPLTALNIKTYEGGKNQPTHPKVLYFKNGWNGHKYWMCYTPYPNNNNNEENPCITYSDDGYNWSEVGISNPIDRPTLSKNFFSDPHLVYREDTNTLECWFRECCNDSSSPDYNKETIWRMTSTDGVIWSNKQELFSYKDTMAEVLSPAIIYDESKYKIWICYKRQSLKYYESIDGTNWQYIRDISINPNDNFKVWHFDIIKTSKGYEFVGCYQYNGQFDMNNYIYYSKSNDNITYSSPIRILGNGPAGSFDDLELYRPCLTQVENKYMMYYGAQKNKKIWSIGLVEAPSMELLNAIMVNNIERNERLKKIEDKISALENGTILPPISPETPSGGNLPNGIPSNDLVLFTSSKGITNESEDKEVWKDLSGNNNHLVLNNFGFNSSSGWLNGGLKCDGTSTYLSLVNEDSFGLDVSKDVTVMIAVKGTTLDSSKSRCFFQTNGWGNGIHISYYRGEGLEFKIGGNGAIKKSLANDTTGQNIINICAIKSNGNNKLYYNNALAGSSISNTSFSKGKLRVMCGEVSSPGDYANGTIYSIAIYNRALSEEEISAIYNYQISLINN